MGSLCTKENELAVTDSRGLSRKNMLGMKTYSINKDYEMERNLGYGSYGEVKLGKHRKTKKPVAIKKINIKDAPPDVKEMIKNEVFVLIECVTLHRNFYRITQILLTFRTLSKTQNSATLLKSN